MDRQTILQLGIIFGVPTHMVLALMLLPEQVFYDGLGAFCIGVGISYFYLTRFRCCPNCHRHALRQFRLGNFAELTQDYSQHRCQKCGAEYVRHAWKWIPRQELDEDDYYWPAE